MSLPKKLKFDYLDLLLIELPIIAFINKPAFNIKNIIRHIKSVIFLFAFRIYLF